jgi:hypothetical protein
MNENEKTTRRMKRNTTGTEGWITYIIRLSRFATLIRLDSNLIRFVGHGAVVERVTALG